MAAGQTAGEMPAAEAAARNLRRSPWERASAITAPGVEHRVILWISSLQPRAAATVAVALTIVVQIGQEEL